MTRTAFHAIITDLAGTPAELIDPDFGTLTGHATTTLWGHTHWTGTNTDLRFPGQQYDQETGLHYNHHRYYNPTTSTYTTPDPLGITPNPTSATAYVHNPHTWTDPLGLECTDGVNNKGNRPPNRSPEGASRRGAFRQAKRDAGIPQTRHPNDIRINTDRRGRTQPGRIYIWKETSPLGETREVSIREDSAGHLFPNNPTQNRGPHFNGPNGDHYDY